MSAVVEEEVKQDDRWLGIYDGLDDQEYRHAPGMNKSSLDLIAVSPLHYQTIRYNPKPPTPAMMFGSAFHCLVLEPEEFNKRYTRAPENAPKRPTQAQLNAAKPSAAAIASIEFWGAFDEENADKQIISTKSNPDIGIWGASDWDRMHMMADNVLQHPFASILIQGVTERSIWWVDPYTHKLCKGRIDVSNEAHSLNVDLKTTNDASYSGFQRSVHSYRYHVQDAFYTDGSNMLDLGTRGMVFVCVEKEPPYAVACYMIEPEWRRVGRAIYQNNLDLYKRCMEREEWPCFAPEIRDLAMPGFAKFHPIS